MRRREFIAFVGGAALWPVIVHAQQRFKIGLLDTGIGTFFTVPFMSKLEELGFVEGKNLVVERRSAEGDNERLKEFAADLVRQRVDVIVTAGTPAGFQPARFPLFLAPTAIRSVSASLRASPGLAEMQPASR